MKRAIGVDIGGTSIRAGLVDEAGHVRHLVRFPTGSASPPDAFLDRIAGVIHQVAGELPDEERRSLAGVGIGFPGLVDGESGYSYYAGNLPGWRPTALVPELRTRLPWPIAIENDVRAGAIGEGALGQARGARVALYVNIGTGVGGALLVNGRIFAGASGLAGEIGHFIIDPGATEYPCTCGNVGDLEALIAGPAIARRARRALNGEEGAGSGEDAQADSPLSGKDVLAQTGSDPRFRRSVEEVVRYTGIGLAGLANILNPDVIVLAGGVGSSPHFPAAQVAAETRRRCLPRIGDGLRIVQAGLGGLSGVVGAAVVLFNRIRHR